MGKPKATCGKCYWSGEYVLMAMNRPNARYVICLNHEYYHDGLFVQANASAEGKPCFAPKLGYAPKAAEAKEPANVSS